MVSFQDQIAESLGASMTPDVALSETDPAELGGYYATSDLAVASLAAAALEVAALKGAQKVEINRKRVLWWFDQTLSPEGWELASIWDAVAGNYQTRDGWIRLHTNAPHHLAAALRVLQVPASRGAVTQAVLGWDKTDLEATIVAEKGAAAAMMTSAEWAAHPQGQAVAAEPLVAWETRGADAPARGLEGLKVLDLTRVLAGPVATRMLAGFGADVLRIDPPHWNETAAEQEVTLGKRCAGLDLTRAEDRARFEALIAGADVIVHGYRKSALEGLGYGAATRAGLNPHLIDVSLNAYGHSGPWADRRGFDSLVQMSTGLAAEGMARAGADAPVPLPVQALDHATGYLIAAAVLRALRVRNAEGRVMSAKLSLARTAAVLASGGVGERTRDLPKPAPEDWGAALEATSWGPAKRLLFPVQINGEGPLWRHPAGALRRAEAAWT